MTWTLGDQSSPVRLGRFACRRDDIKEMADLTFADAFTARTFGLLQQLVAVRTPDDRRGGGTCALAVAASWR